MDRARPGRLAQGASGTQVAIPKTAAESDLKGVPLPAIGARPDAAFPLLIQEQAIGWVVVFDMGEGHMEDRDFSNLRILCSQIAIGLEKATLYDKVQRLSITDGLTGLTVHRHFQARLDEELKRAERFKEPLGLVMLDIDHFKRFNDVYGHLAGDAVLKAVAGAMKQDLASSELAARYGGEEFALVLPRLDRRPPRPAPKPCARRSASSRWTINGRGPGRAGQPGRGLFPRRRHDQEGPVGGRRPGPVPEQEERPGPGQRSPAPGPILTSPARKA